jgi:hypothetical protein
MSDRPSHNLPARMAHWSGKHRKTALLPASMKLLGDWTWYLPESRDPEPVPAQRASYPDAY